MKKKWIFAGLGLTVFALDRLAKILATAMLADSGSQKVIPYVLELRYSQNRGMALGLFSGNTLATLLLPLAAVGIWFFVFRKHHPTGFTVAATALVAGGFAGNFVDRLLWGYVVDMVYFPFLPWFICNVADVGICLGVGMLALSLFLRPQDWREQRAEENGDNGQ